MTLIVGQQYRVMLSGYDLAGYFIATYVGEESQIDAKGTTDVYAVWSNGVRLETWGYSDERHSDYGWFCRVSDA